MYEACRAALVSFRSTAAAYKVGWVACLPVAVNRCTSAHAVLPSGHRVVSNNSGGVRGALNNPAVHCLPPCFEACSTCMLLSNRTQARCPSTVQAFVLLSQKTLLHSRLSAIMLKKWPKEQGGCS